jgi:hypothetical protein
MTKRWEKRIWQIHTEEPHGSLTDRQQPPMTFNGKVLKEGEVLTAAALLVWLLIVA